MIPATVTGYEPASLGSGAGEGPEPSRWHFLYNDLAFLGGDGHSFLVVPSPAVLDFGDLRGTGISNAVLPYFYYCERGEMREVRLTHAQREGEGCESQGF